MSQEIVSRHVCVCVAVFTKQVNNITAGTWEHE